MMVDDNDDVGDRVVPDSGHDDDYDDDDEDDGDGDRAGHDSGHHDGNGPGRDVDVNDDEHNSRHCFCSYHVATLVFPVAVSSSTFSLLMSLFSLRLSCFIP